MDSTWARAVRCRHVHTALHTPLAATTITAPRYPTSPTPQRLAYGQKRMPTPSSTDSVSRRIAGHDVVCSRSVVTVAFAAGAAAAGPFFSGKSCASEIDSSCLSIFAISLSQSFPPVLAIRCFPG
jgi:hypothetical protein